MDGCVKALENLKEEENSLGKPTFIDKLKEDLIDGGTYKGHHVVKMKNPAQFKTTKNAFIDAIIENLAAR